MKRFLLVFCVLSLYTTNGFCAKGWCYGDMGKGCIVEDTNMFHADNFYYCEGAEKKPGNDCDGVTANRSDRKKTLTLGQSVNGYFCCEVNNIRKFIASKAKTEKNTKKKSTDGKRECVYDKVLDGCGNETSTPCNPECPTGQVSHPFTGECVTPCPDGNVFESEMSTRCIECPITAHSGPVRVVNTDKEYVGSYCKTCNGTSQIFDSREPEETVGGSNNLCVDITTFSDTNVVSKTQMSKCALCPGDLFEKCVKCINNGCNSDTDLREKCRLK